MPKARAAGFNPASIKLKGVITFKMLDVVTNHITKEDNALLRDSMEVLTQEGDVDSHSYMEYDLPSGYAMPYEGGWLVRVVSEPDPDEGPLWEDRGFSEAFVNLLAVCRTHGFGYLRLDRDGDAIEGLPTFDW